jgi:hypothetical protein
MYIFETFQVLMFSHQFKSTLNGTSGAVLSIVYGPLCVVTKFHTISEKERSIKRLSEVSHDTVYVNQVPV